MAVKIDQVGKETARAIASLWPRLAPDRRKSELSKLIEGKSGIAAPIANAILVGLLDKLSAEDANQALLDFMQERWKGIWPILYGDQLRQIRFDDWLFQGVLDVEHAPRADDTTGAAPGAGDATAAPVASGQTS